MRPLFSLIFCISLSTAFSQTLPDFDKIKLETAADYRAADSVALTASNFLLIRPFDFNDINNVTSQLFILKWMSGTPDYGFTFADVTSKILNDKRDLTGLYLACLVKFCLENKSSAKDQNIIKLNSLKLLLTYCENPLNKVKMTKQLKKLSEANKKGELEKEL